MESSLAQNLELADKKARYDRCAKKVIAYKAICAWILKTCTEEFSGLDVRYIANKCISDVTVSEKAVHQDEPDRNVMLSGDDRIALLSSESSSVSEGTIYYDVRFRAGVAGSGETVGLFINIEVQNEDDPGRTILPRAEYYCARMISEQYGTVFTKSHYQKIEKVYSVWICPDPAEKRKNGVFRFPRMVETLCGRPAFRKKDYDKSEYIVIFAGEPDGHECSQITDLLYTVFSDKMSVSEKKERLSSVYGIEMTEEIETEVHEMCNLSEGIAAANWERGHLAGQSEGHAKGFSEGRTEGRLIELAELVDDGLLSAEVAALRSGLDLDEFLSKKEELQKNREA